MLILKRLSALQQTVMGGAFIIGCASILSRVLGLFRDRLLSTTFGAGQLLDSYFTAFKIPDFLFNIFVLGIVSAAFVPVYLEFKEKKGKEESLKITTTVLNIILVVLIIIGGLCYFFAPQLVNFLAYGDDANERLLTIQFTRIFLFSLIFFGASNVCSGFLHAHKKFLSYALAPIFYNLGIILGIVLFVPLWGATGLAWGVVFGAFLHFFIQIPALRSANFRYSFLWQWQHEGVKKIFRLMPARSLALGLMQLNSMVLFSLASILPAGSRAVWQFAENIQHFPINIFGVSLALAVFPVFSEAFAQNDIEKFKKNFSQNFRRILFFIIPISIVTLLLRAQIVRLVYGAGKFDWEDTILTAQILGTFAVSMFAQATIPLLARAFFAQQDTKTPVLISAGAMVTNIILALLLVGKFEILGLALAYSFAAIGEMLALLVILRLKYGDLEDEVVVSSLWKIIIASLAMGIIVHGMKYTLSLVVDMHTFLGIFWQTAGATISGVIIYLAIAVKFHFSEAKIICGKILSTLIFVRNFWRNL